jgi:MYXO-CTERM domain-containing protein
VLGNPHKTGFLVNCDCSGESAPDWVVGVLFLLNVWLLRRKTIDGRPERDWTLIRVL